MSNPEVPVSLINVARILRALALLATLSATIAMATAREIQRTGSPNNPSSNYLFKVDYKDLMCFKAFMGVNIAATAYSLFAVSLPIKSMLWRFVMVLDVIMFALLASIDSVAITSAYLHKNGDSQAFWPPICLSVPTYCGRVMGAIVTGFAGAGIYMLIVMYSISVILNPFLVSS